jgi:hypothetical protein
MEINNKGKACIIFSKKVYILISYGLFGASIYSSLKNVLNVVLNEKNFFNQILNHFILNLKNSDSEGLMNINSFIQSLPKIDLIYEIISKRLYNDLELFPIKLILDLLLYYFQDNEMVENEVYCIIKRRIIKNVLMVQ